jgi:ketosteroid isomerase-like protein
MTVAEVSTVAQAFHDGFANKTLRLFSSLYHDDARFLVTGTEPVEGRPAIERAFQQLFDMGARSVDVEALDVREAGD